jgi:hypothetical protein
MFGNPEKGKHLGRSKTPVKHQQRPEVGLAKSPALNVRSKVETGSKTKPSNIQGSPSRKATVPGPGRSASKSPQHPEDSTPTKGLSSGIKLADYVKFRQDRRSLQKLGAWLWAAIES